MGSWAVGQQEVGQRLQEILNGLFAFVGLLSPEGIILEVNRAPLQASRLERKDVLGKAFGETYWWSYSPEVRSWLEALIRHAASGEYVRCDTRVRITEERYITIDFSLNPLFDANGRVHQLVASAVDISERTRAEATLRGSEERFRQVVENIREVFWLTNVEKNQVLYVSPGYEQIWGRSCESLYRSPQAWIEAIHPDDRERIRAASLSQVLETFNEEYRIIRPDGMVRWIHDRAFPVTGEGGDRRVVGIAEDITERKEAEEARLKSETDFRVIFENAALGIALVDSAGRPIKANRALQQFLGYTEEELRGMAFAQFTHPDDLAADLVLYHELTGGKREHYQIEKRYLRKDGETVCARLTVSVVRAPDGGLRYAISMVEDITEKKKLESQFLCAQRLETMGALASGVAHDLNNILTPILMSAPLLRQGLPPAEQERTLSIIETSAQRGADLVRQLLTIGRGRGDKRILVEIGKLGREMAAFVSNTFPKSIRVQSELAEELWPVLADATQLHQVLLNLCVNARDAMPQGGTLTLAVQNIVLDGRSAAALNGASPGRHVRLRLSDTGEGIPPAVMSKIYEPFFTTKEPGRGTGLGLMAVLRIVKGHGGFIEVQSEVGKGSTFSVYLPAA